MSGHPTRRIVATGVALMAHGGSVRASEERSVLRRYVSLVTRADSMAHDAFIEALLVQGVRGRSRLSGLSGLVISEVVPRFNGRSAQLDTDAVLEVWTRDDLSYRAMLETAEGRAWAGAIDALVSRRTTYATHEHRFVPPRARDKVLRGMGLVVRMDGWSRDRFKSQWLGVHGPMATKVPGLLGFVLSEIDSVHACKGELVMSECDGIAESWWDTPADAPPGSSVASDYAKVWHARGDLFLQRDRARNLSLRSHEFVSVAA